MHNINVLVLFQEHSHKRNFILNFVDAHSTDHQSLQPIQKLGSAGFFLDFFHIADLIKRFQRLLAQLPVNVSEMHLDDLLHLFLVFMVSFVSLI